MLTVQIFKTDVQDELTARQIIQLFQKTFTWCKVSFDLDDCDKVLRIEHQQEPIEDIAIQMLVAERGHTCEPLVD